MSASSSSSRPSVLDPRLLPPGAGAGDHFAPHPSHPRPYPAHNAHTAPTAPLGIAAHPATYPQDNPYFANPARVNSEVAVDSIEAQEHDYDSGDGQHSPNDNLLDPKRSRACEACRGLKVRCEQDQNDADRPCKRCAKANRQCIITQPSRKRLKKADGRVAELEKKLDALTAVLHAQQSGAPMRLDALQARPAPEASRYLDSRPPAPPANAQHRSDYPTLANAQPAISPAYHMSSEAPQQSKKRKVFPESAQTLPSPASDKSRPGRTSSQQATGSFKNVPCAETEFFANCSNNPQAVRRRVRALLDPATYNKIFARYTNELAPHLPVVVFPEGTTAEHVLEEKPVLFLVICAAACAGMVPEEKHVILSEEVIDVTADCVIRNAVKSLELVQALQVAVMWYKPPVRRDQANFYQIIHLAAVMALDIGLGRRHNPARANKGWFTGGVEHGLRPEFARPVSVDSDAIDSRRAWLACYYLCASVSMVLRRPNLIRWTNYMQECLDFLESSPDAAPTDKLFTQHVRSQRICEEIAASFMLDDASATTISIADPKVSYTLNVLEQKLKDWEDQIPRDVQRPELTFFRHCTSLYLHEIAMHVDHNIDDFRLPFTEDSLRSGSQISHTLTLKHMAALEACVSAAHGVIDSYCNFGPDLIMCLPTLLYFIRCVYALVILIKLHTAATAPGSELGKIISPEDVKVQEKIDRLWDLFTHLSSLSDVRKPHAKVLKILGLLKEWFGAQQKGDKAAAESAAPPHSAHLKPNKHGRNAYGYAGDSKLHLLSEAATSGESTAGASAGMQPVQPSPPSANNQSWTFDRPSLTSHVGPRHMAWQTSSEDLSRHNSGASSYTAPTPASALLPASSSASAFPNNDQMQAPYPDFLGTGDNNNNDNSGMDFDWTANMDLEQVLNGALRDIEFMSGDLGGWFAGDGMGSFPSQIPAADFSVANTGAAKW